MNLNYQQQKYEQREYVKRLTHFELWQTITEETFCTFFDWLTHKNHSINFPSVTFFDLLQLVSLPRDGDPFEKIVRWIFRIKLFGWSKGLNGTRRVSWLLVKRRAASGGTGRGSQQLKEKAVSNASPPPVSLSPYNYTMADRHGA